MNQHPKQIAAFYRAKEHDGLKEIVGPQHNPAIVDWFRAVGHGWVKDDETAWCAAFVGAMLEEAGLPSTKALNARSYDSWGEKVEINDAKPGDIVTFWRESESSWKGHVGFYVGRQGKDIRVLGGNQRNAVNVSLYPSRRLLSVRRMPAPPGSIAASRDKFKTKSSQSFIQTLINLLGGLFGGRKEKRVDDNT